MFSLATKMSPTVTDMIRFDHSHVLVTFHQYTADKSPTVRKALAETICKALEIHATLEEEIFYPAIRELNAEGSVIKKSVPEHDEMRRLITELRMTSPTQDRHAEVLLELMRDVLHHVADEESVLLPKAERRLSKQQLSQLGAAMTKRRLELLAPQAGKIAADTVIGFSGSTAAKVAGLTTLLLAVIAFKKPRAHS